jgi:hypothetical protein
MSQNEAAPAAAKTLRPSIPLTPPPAAAVDALALAQLDHASIREQGLKLVLAHT